MKKSYLLLLALLFSPALRATHLEGAFLSYEVVDSSKDLYRIHLVLYRITGFALLPDTVNVRVQTDFGNYGRDIVLYKFQISNFDDEQHCFEGDTTYEKAHYRSDIVILPDAGRMDLYTTSKDIAGNTQPGNCCRSTEIKNILNPGSVGQVSYCRSFYRHAFPANNAPRIIRYPRFYFPEGKESHTRLLATDPDGDSLAYRLSPSFNASPYDYRETHPFDEVPYAPTYSAEKPLGQDALIEINAESGLIHISGAEAGKYAVTFEIREYRHDTLIGLYYFDMTVNVSDSALFLSRSALKRDTLVTCNGYIERPAPCSDDLFWDFTWPGNSDTSSKIIPEFRYPNPGTYTLLLVQNARSSSPDSSFFTIRYLDSFNHGLPPDSFWALPDSLTLCREEPFLLPLATRGTIRWEPDTGICCGQGKMRWLTPVQPGIYAAVNDYRGCLFRDTLFFDLYSTDSLSISPDTIKCKEDKIRLSASGFYAFDWKPDKNISNTKIASPLVWPEKNTTYTLTGSYGGGCSRQLETTVLVHETVPGKIDVLPDEKKCKEDTVRIEASGYVSYKWKPNEYISSDSVPDPRVWPPGNKTYTLIGTDSNGCRQKQTVRISLHYNSSRLNFSPGRNVCIGDTLRITAVNFTSIRWKPDSLFDNDTQLVQILSPRKKITFTINGIDNNGCRRNAEETVFVQFPPDEISLSSDSLSGCLDTRHWIEAISGRAENFIWEPSDWIARKSGKGKVKIVIKGDTIFTLSAISKWGCQRDTTFKVTISRTDSSSIGGTIRSSSDYSLLGNVRISLIHFNPADSSLTAETVAHSASNGKYSFKTDLKSFVLRASTYHDLSLKNHLPQYFRNKPFWNFANTQQLKFCIKSDTTNFILLPEKSRSANGILAGKVTDEAGNALAGMILYLSDTLSDSLLYSSMSDQNGLFFFGDLPLESFALLGDWPGLANKKAPILHLDAANPVLNNLAVKKKGQELVIETGTGLEEGVPGALFRLWPNPVVERLHLESRDPGIRPYRILDMPGTLRKSGFIHPSENIISLEGLAPGSYLFILEGKEGPSIQVFIKL